MPRNFFPAFFRLFRPLDAVVIALAVAASVFAVRYAAFGGGAAQAVIDAPTGQWVYPLDRDADVRVPGGAGESVLQIRGGTIRFTDSPCRNKLCVLHAPLTVSGDWSACLPNQIFIRIDGGVDSGVDATAY